MTDEFGDGICCDFGNGFFELTDNDDLLIEGGSFGSSDSYNFCLEEDNVGLYQSDVDAIEMYPNPASDRITFLPQKSTTYNFTIYDATGRVIDNKIALQGTHQINISDFASGIYQVKFEMQGSSVTKKFIKK